MKKGPSVHVTPRGSLGWAVKKAGAQRASSIERTQAAAAEKAKPTAIKNHSEVVIHDRKGRIRAKDSYGNDPFPPKG